MKKVIDGRVYNTDTAKEVYRFCNGLENDLHFVEETLYQKRNGEYFLAGRGGAATKYAKRVDASSWVAGARIIPLTRWEAEEYLEYYKNQFYSI